MSGGSHFGRLLAAGMLGLFLGTGAVSAKTFTIAAGPLTSDDFAAAVAIETVVRLAIGRPEMSIHPRLSGSSVERLRLLQNGRVDFAIIDAAGAAPAGGVTVMRHDVRGTRAVTMLWRLAAHIAVRPESSDGPRAEAHDISLLKRDAIRAIGLDAGDAIGRAYALRLLGQLGLAHEGTPIARITLEEVAADTLMRDLSAGKIQAAILWRSVPAPLVQSAYRSTVPSISLLPVTDAEVAAIDPEGSVIVEHPVPAGTYAGQTVPLPVMTRSMVLMARDDLADDAVYNLVRALYENLDVLSGVYAPMADMSLATATSGVPTILHNGAIKYFAEVGVSLPAALKP